MPLERIDSASIAIAFDLATAGLCISRNRVIEHCNHTFSDMFGYQADELAGKNLQTLYPSFEEYEHFGRLGLSVMRVSGTYADDRIMRHRDSHLFWCHVSGRSLDRSDPYAYAIWTFQDLSQERPVAVRLTLREREVAQLLLSGKSSKQIAKSLALSPRTVEAHRMRLMRKLDAKSIGDLIAKLLGYQKMEDGSSCA